MITHTTLKHSINSLLNKASYLLVCTLFLGLAFIDNAAASEKQRLGTIRAQIKAPEKDYVENEVLVKFASDTSDVEKQEIRNSVGATLIRTVRSIELEYWQLPAELSTADAIPRLVQHPSVEYAEPNYIREPSKLPNDIHFNQLWHLDNTGQTINGLAGLRGADIDARAAWNIETGSSDVVIAVIDTGVAYEHPDLWGNTWLNQDEIPDNGIDDDKNGYIDDIHGWDFVSDDNNPSDYSSSGHGTHVAGTIAATGDNNVGVTGVMWRAQIMPLQVLNFNGTTTSAFSIVDAIDYAINNDARIINMSLGGGGFSTSDYEIIALANEKGILVVVAAGNGGGDGIGDNNDFTPSYPASYDLPNIISVAATDSRDVISSYSNYGPVSVDIAAPGGSGSAPHIFSTLPPERTGLISENFDYGAANWYSEGIYEPWSIRFNASTASKVLASTYDVYHENENSFVRMLSPININGMRGIYVSTLLTYDVEYNKDYCHVEGSADGNNYQSLGSFTGNSNGPVSVAGMLSEIEQDSLHLGFRLHADQAANLTGCTADDLTVSGIPWMFVGSEQGYKSGTSMATPVVAGVAGLIWSSNPHLSHLEVKDIILSSGDPLPTLTGKIVSGRRVNAYNALSITPPSGWVSIWGTVAKDSAALCTLALANGQDMFTCGNNLGKYAMTVPLDDNNMVTIQSFSQGLAPFRKDLTPQQAYGYGINMAPAGLDAPIMVVDYQVSSSHSLGRYLLSGTITDSSSTPVCAMVLANGQKMFSCGSDLGRFELEVPLGPKGNITLFGFASGLQSYKVVFDPVASLN